MTLRTSYTLRRALAVLEIISETPKLVLEMLLAKKQGPAVITQLWLARTASSHGQLGFE